MSLAQPFLYFADPTPNGNHRNLPCLQGQLEMPSNKHLQPISTLPTTRPQQHSVIKYSDFFAHWWSTLRCVFHTLSCVPKEPTPVGSAVVTCWLTHLLFSWFFPPSQHCSTVLLFSDISSLRNYLYLNPCLRIWFWGNLNKTELLQIML